MREHGRDGASGGLNAGGDASEADGDFVASTDVQFDEECRTAAAKRLALACGKHPAHAAGVARAIGMGTRGALTRFYRYTTGEKTAPSSVLDKIAKRCPRVWAEWLRLAAEDYAQKARALEPQVAIARAAVKHAQTEIVTAEAQEDGVIEPPEAALIADATDAEITALEEKTTALRAYAGGKS